MWPHHFSTPEAEHGAMGARNLRRALLTLAMLALVLAQVLAGVQPAQAQEQWPSGRGAALPRDAAPADPQPAAADVAAGRTAATPPPDLLRTLPVAPMLPAPHGATIPAGRAAPLAQPLLPGDAAEPADLVIHLAMPSLAQQTGALGDPAARRAYAAAVAATQARVAGEVAALGGRVVYRFTTLSSGLAVQAPAGSIAALAAIDGVAQVTRVGAYSMNLAEVVPFIGAAHLQDLGVTGAGVTVAVLDSGIDFTHLAFGGPGTTAAWAAAYYGADPACDPAAASDPDCAYARPADPALFGPQALRVKGGYDYVGEAWRQPGDPLTPDANPIDRHGHGTQLAALAAGDGYPAGVSEDGAYPAQGAGVAPDADLYAFKVCAATGLACSGLALLAALDDAADLDDEPATVDPAAVVNLAVSAVYGQPEDSLTYLVDAATRLGMIVVAAAGNAGNRPFIVGSPSTGDGAISVAETAAPAARRYPLFYAFSVYSGKVYDTVLQPWSARPGDVRLAGPLYYGQTADVRRGCVLDAAGQPLPDVNPFPDVTGNVVLVDRGGCDFYLKAANAAAAGAILVVIGLTAPGEPFAANSAGAPLALPVLMIDQAAADALRAGSTTGVTAGLDPADAISLAATVAATASRGPRNNDGKIKPDLAAPGQALAARAASGVGNSSTGGASGAAALVTGVAALLRQVYGDALTPVEYKALLMNSADLNLRHGEPGGSLASITRIGGGQVNALAAYSSTLVAWDSTDADPLMWSGSLSFGYAPASAHLTATRTLTIRNLLGVAQTVRLASFFRYMEDFGQGVYVTPGAASVVVPAGGAVTVPVVLEVEPARALHPWVIDRGRQGANGELLRYQEYDGYVRITPQTGAPLHVVWQVLPRAVAETQLVEARSLFGTVTLANPAGVAGASEAFDLVSADGNDYNYTVGVCARSDLPPGCDASPVDLKEVGVRYRVDASGPVPRDLVEFAVTLWDAPYRASQAPAEVRIYLDVDGDGADDFAVFNGDATLDYADGRSTVFVENLADGHVQPHRFVDGTFNSQNFILPVELAAIGAAPGQPLRFSVFAYNAYWNRQLWDCAPKQDFLCTGAFQYTPGVARFAVPPAQQTFVLSPTAAITITWATAPGTDAASPAQTGLLFLHRAAPVGRESDHLVIAPPYLPAPAVALMATPAGDAGAAAGATGAYTLTATVTITGGGRAAAPVAGREVFFTDGTFNAALGSAGQASFRLDPATGAVHYTLDFTGVAAPTRALLRLGQPGDNGPVHVWLWDATGVFAPAGLPATGVFTPTAALFSQVLRGNLYVQVHSAAEGDGLHGQIAQTPAVFTDAQGVAALLWRPAQPGAYTIYAMAGPGGGATQVAVVAKMFLPLVEFSQD